MEVSRCQPATSPSQTQQTAAFPQWRSRTEMRSIQRRRRVFGCLQAMLSQASTPPVSVPDHLTHTINIARAENPFKQRPCEPETGTRELCAPAFFPTRHSDPVHSRTDAVRRGVTCHRVIVDRGGKPRRLVVVREGQLVPLELSTAVCLSHITYTSWSGS